MPYIDGNKRGSFSNCERSPGLYLTTLLALMTHPFVFPLDVDPEDEDEEDEDDDFLCCEATTPPIIAPRTMASATMPPMTHHHLRLLPPARAPAAWPADHKGPELS